MSDEIDSFILEVAQKITPEQFDFTVTVDGLAYDVYRFEALGKGGQLAFCKEEGKFTIAMFRAGWEDAEAVEHYLREVIRRDRRLH